VLQGACGHAGRVRAHCCRRARGSKEPSAAQHSTAHALRSAAQHSTAQRRTAQHGICSASPRHHMRPCFSLCCSAAVPRRRLPHAWAALPRDRVLCPGLTGPGAAQVRCAGRAPLCVRVCVCVRVLCCVCCVYWTPRCAARHAAPHTAMHTHMHMHSRMPVSVRSRVPPPRLIGPPVCPSVRCETINHFASTTTNNTRIRSGAGSGQASGLCS
jgi:hypothetical protein